MGTIARLRAGAYVRCSHDKRDGASISQQEDDARKDCAENGWELVLYDADNDRSASRFSGDERPDWDRLLADLKAGQLDVVLLWETSRGDRKNTEWSAFLDLCRHRGALIHVHTHHRTYDVAIARDWRTLAEDGVDNAYESEKTSLRVKRDLARAAARGRPHGPAQYGYARRYDPVTREYVTQEKDPPKSDIAEDVITRIARSEPLSHIKADLEARGIPSPSGLPEWDRFTLRTMGLNPAYAGCRRTGDGDLVQGWPPIVSMETHLAAVRVLTGRSGPKRPGRQKYLLTEYARCDAAGAELAVRKQAWGDQYTCRGHGCVNVSVEWLDEHIAALVCRHLSEPDAAALYRTDSTAAAGHRAEAAELRAQLDEWARASVNPRAYQIKEEQLLPRIERAERDAAAAETPLVLRDLLTAQNVRAGWDALGIPARRAIIRALMKVKVARARDWSRAARTDPERIIIEWKRGQD